MTFAEYLIRMAVVGFISVSTSAALLICLYKFIRARESAAERTSLNVPAFFQESELWHTSNVGPQLLHLSLNHNQISTANVLPSFYSTRRMTSVSRTKEDLRSSVVLALS